MAQPRFKAGQKVKIVANPLITNARGSFEVVCLLPEERGMNQYRIKSTLDGQVRVVVECEIV